MSTTSDYASNDKAIYGLGIRGVGGQDGAHWCNGPPTGNFEVNHLANRCPNLQGNSCDEWYPVGFILHRGRGNQECGNVAWIR